MEIINTSKAPKAVGPYSQAILTSNFLFCSGQIALDPATGEMETGGVEAEAERVLTNLKAVLNQSGLDFSDCVKVEVFLIDMNDFQTVNEIYAKHFGDHKPARQAIGVASLPKGARVEISAIAKTR